MSVPTANNPSPAVFSSALGLGAVTSALIPLTEGAGNPQEYVNKVNGFPTIGYGTESSSTGIGVAIGTGSAPVWNPTGFPYTPNGGDPTIKFESGTACLQFISACPGWQSAAQKSIGIVFKTRYSNIPTAVTAMVTTLVQYGSGPPTNITLNISAAGVITLSLVRNNNTVVLTMPTGLSSLVNGTWYALLLTLDDTNHVRIIRLFDYAQQLVMSGVGGTSTADATLIGASASPTDVSINPSNTSLLGQIGFCGEVYCVTFLTGLPTDADFTTWYSDPKGAARGTYTPSGGLTAGILSRGEVLDTSAVLSWTRATGTGTGGTGNPTYNLYRSTDVTTAAGAGTLVYSGSALTFQDTGLTPFTPYHYYLQAVDGTSTVTFAPNAPVVANNPVSVCTFYHPTLTGVDAGDSITASVLNVPNQGLYCHTQGVARLNFLNRGISGAVLSNSGTAGWSPGIGPQISTISITGGPPTGGSFTVNTTKTVGGSGTQTTGAIAWNATAAAVKAALEANSDIGAGNTIVTGGPFPGTPMTITFTGARAVDGFTIALGLNSLTASGAPAFATSQNAYPVGSLYPLMIAEALAMRQVDFVSFGIGTNDADSTHNIPVAQHTLGLIAFCNAVRRDLLPTFPALKIILHAPPYRVASGTVTQAGLLQGYRNVSIPAAAAAVPGVYVGDMTNYQLTANNPLALTSDGLHMNNSTFPWYALNQVQAVIKIMFPTASSGGRGSTRVSLG